MISVLESYTEKANFWKCHPTFKGAKVFKEFYDSDKTKNKTYSSTIMWSLAFMFDKTSENPWREMQHIDRIELINEDIIGNIEFDWKPYQEIWNYTEKCFFNEDERTLYSYIEKVEERRRLIETTPYTLENAAALDKMIKETDFVRKEINELKRIIEQKSVDGKTKGNIIESATERGLM